MSTTPNSALAWRNWCFDADSSIAEGTGTFEANAPVESMLTPQLGDVAISTNTTNNSFVITLASGTGHRPVHVIALLNTNVVSVDSDANSLLIQLTDDSSVQDSLSIEPVLIPTNAGDFQTHLIYPVPETGLSCDRDRIRFITISASPTDGLECGTIDPFTGTFTQAPFSCGAMWASPLWVPPRGIRLRSPVASVLEERRGVVSIGRQRYTSVEPRVRSLRFELSLPESSVYSTDINAPSVQQMAAWCGLSRPLLVMPQKQDADLLYMTGFYGYLDEPVAWSTIDRGEEREYLASVQVTEGL